jgi:hypothetical protein
MYTILKQLTTAKIKVEKGCTKNFKKKNTAIE